MKTREETPAKVIIKDQPGFQIETTLKDLRKCNWEIFLCEAGDQIPMDGEIIEGLATIDESAITGESAPVIREAGATKAL